MAAPPRDKGVRVLRLADYVARQLDPLIAKQGFSETSLLTRWREIVGPRIAEICEPMRLQWPPRARVKVEGKERVSEPATLILRVEPGFGLEAQHLTPAIIDRVNAHLGWRCVSRAVLRQEPLLGGGGRTKDKTRPLPPRDPAARARAEAATEGVATQSLRAALTALGENALAPGPFGKSGESK